MPIVVYTRYALVDHRLAADEPALLLEGSWPERPDDVVAAAAPRWSLDDMIDGRFAWIDQRATDWAEALAEGTAPNRVNPIALLCYLNALDLRYYLVKLLRVAAFFTEVRPLDADDALTLVLQRGRDDDYANLLAQLTRSAEANYQQREAGPADMPPLAFAANGLPRRWLGRLAACVAPRRPAAARPRVVLCGNPRLLDPVCHELTGRGAAVWWLYDRFAWHSWKRWRGHGVGQLVCNSSQGQTNRLTLPPSAATASLLIRGVDLAPTVVRWLQRRSDQAGARQTRLLEQIDRHFQRVRPDVLVLDEDATPLNRAAVWVARRRETTSAVLQHGAPFTRFAFAPLAADRFLAWGHYSQRQLLRWNIPRTAVVVTGSPWHDELRATAGGGDLRSQKRLGRRLATTTATRVLLVMGIAPRDERPEPIALRFTSHTYEEMVRTAVAGLAARGGVTVTLKPHPRGGDDPIVRKVLSEYPQLAVLPAEAARWEDLLAQCDCVVSCGSSGGIDATLTGLPVIQVMPRGWQEMTATDGWGLLGVARGPDEFAVLLSRALDAPRAAAAVDAGVFGTFQTPAAARVVDEIESMAHRSAVPFRSAPEVRRKAG